MKFVRFLGRINISRFKGIDNIIRLTTIICLMGFNMLIGGALEEVTGLHILMGSGVSFGLYIIIENGLKSTIKIEYNEDIDIDVPIE